MKKIVLSKEQIDEIANIYKNDNIGLAKIGEKYGISKPTIRRILSENGVDIIKPGQRFKGGKLEVCKRYYQKHKEKLKSYKKEYYQNNKTTIKNYHQKWREDNKLYLKEYKREYQKKLINKNIKYKLSSRFKTAVWDSIKQKKELSYFSYLGYTLDELMAHLELLFTDGMSWENYGEWHIDHIIPTSKFNFKSIDCEDFKECWSLSNLQPMWAKDNYSKNNRIVAHQYKIRKQKEMEERDSLTFNPNNVSLNKTKIEVIDRRTCEKIIDEYEWLGYMPRYTNLHFGIYFEVDGKYHLGGVVAYQPEYGENLGVWDKYGFTNKIIQLSRGVCLWWTPKNTASFFIQRTLEYLKKNSSYKVVTATVDSSAGEIGVIYQSLNWHYVGLFGGNLTKTGKERIRYGYKIGDKIYNQRHIRERIGSAAKENVMKHFPEAQVVNLGRKKRYFTFIGTKKENNELIKSIENLIKPYPKK
jgi:hypothetical protein